MIGKLDVVVEGLCFTLVNNIMSFIHSRSNFPELVLSIFNLARRVQKRVLLLPLSDVLDNFQISWDRHSTLLAERLGDERTGASGCRKSIYRPVILILRVGR